MKAAGSRRRCPRSIRASALADYRKWLPASSLEANLSLGGSFIGATVDDYYLTPYDIGYGHIVKFDHDFIGRDALEKRAGEPHKHKRTLRWSKDDVVRIFASQLGEGERHKFMDMPASHYATCPYDDVQVNGQTRGDFALPGLHLERAKLDFSGTSGRKRRRAGHRGHADLG